MPLRRLPRAILIALTISAATGGCSRNGPDLNSIPATFVGALQVEPKGHSTLALYEDLVRLGQAYGLRSAGDGATGGREWEVQFHCTSNYAGSAITVGEGDFVLFQASSYAFARTEDYQRFKVELMALMHKHGQIMREEERPPLEADDLLARGKHMGMDVMSRCSPPTVNTRDR